MTFGQKTDHFLEQRYVHNKIEEGIFPIYPSLYTGRAPPHYKNPLPGWYTCYNYEPTSIHYYLNDISNLGKYLPTTNGSRNCRLKETKFIPVQFLIHEKISRQHLKYWPNSTPLLQYKVTIKVTDLSTSTKYLLIICT